ncbi:MAG: polysaccharide deacetylase family protein [Chloroflexi bacterium]|nr:polysaccharide deacetylase family protein [Chloroflexota bacterium]
MKRRSRNHSNGGAKFLGIIFLIAASSIIWASWGTEIRHSLDLWESPTQESPPPTLHNGTAVVEPMATFTSRPTEPPTPTTTVTPTGTPTPTPEPQPTPDGIFRQARIPILMYHYISVPPPDADAIRRDLSVSPEQFEAQLHYLRNEGYQTITLRDLILHLTTGYPLPTKPIVLTFDDGYRDHYTNAFPLLRKYGYVGTFFVVTQFLDEGYEAYMTWEQVVEMSAAGMDIEAHSHSHREMHNQSLDFVVFEVLRPKEAIEARLHKPVRFFCYPSGKSDEQTVQVLHSANYWGAVTVAQGALHDSDHLFQLKRIRVRGRYTVEDLDEWITFWMNQ